MWAGLRGAGGPENVPTRTLNDLRLFRGGRGIYADGASTRTSGWQDGATVFCLHNGNSYADELSADGVRYHYPRTARPGRDRAEIAATKAVHAAGLPIFVVTVGRPSNTRTVYRGFVEAFDDDLEVFLVTFTTGAFPEVISPDDSDDDDFVATDDGEPPASIGRVKRRPNQQRFAFKVLRRYGPRCAACGLAIPEMLHAAHLWGKKERGSDHARNGLPLCANHHIAFDSKLWGIDVSSTCFVSRSSGPSLAALGITCTSLAHLTKQPHPAALEHEWKRYRGSENAL